MHFKASFKGGTFVLKVYIKLFPIGDIYKSVSLSSVLTFPNILGGVVNSVKSTFILAINWVELYATC
jgi:hypothetical protein